MIINDKRELAYIVNVDDIQPIEGSDNCEAAIIGGWKVMVVKNEFHKGDKAVYFEIDSKVPETEAFSFLAKKKYKIKTQRYTFGGKGLFISQGLIMPLSTFNLKAEESEIHQPMTDQLGVTYYIEKDNKRKSNVSKYDSMKARHKELFKKQPYKYLMTKKWGRDLLFLFFGKKKDKVGVFPTKFKFIHKTDEERIENMPWLVGYKNPLIVTEKVDGTSCTYILEKKLFGYEFYVASRNLRQATPDQKTYHQNTGQDEVNIYWQLAFKYDIENKLKQYLKDNKLKYVCIQGEGVGNVQGNPLKLKENDLYVFNFIRSDVGRLSTLDGKNEADKLGFKWVPILDTEYYMPQTMEEIKLFADGKSSINSEVNREGLVLRDPKHNLSFKNVSRLYLLGKD